MFNFLRKNKDLPADSHTMFGLIDALNYMRFWTWAIEKSISLHQDQLSWDELEMLKGDLIILLAVVTWAYYTVKGKPLVEKYGAFRVTAYVLGAGSIIYFPFGLYRTINADWSQMDSMAWLSIGYIAIGTSVIAYSLWYWLLKYLDASQLAVLNNLQPIVAGFLGYLMLGELMSLPFVIAGVVIIAGVTITQKT